MPFGEKNDCKVYIDGEYVGTAKDITITNFVPDRDAVEAYVRKNIVMALDTNGEFVGTCTIKKITMFKLSGLWYWVMYNCPNKKLVWLMKHGKNARVKMKNYRRAIEEIGKHIVEDKR